MLEETTVGCKICGAPYVFYAFLAGDQSACPDCVAKARKNMGETYATSTIIVNDETLRNADS